MIYLNDVSFTMLLKEVIYVPWLLEEKLFTVIILKDDFRAMIHLKKICTMLLKDD